MLQLRKAQMGVFEAQSRERFVAGALSFLREHWPEETEEAGEAAARESVDAAIKTCAAAGIEREGEVLRYLNVEFFLGEEFDPVWVGKILRDPELDATQKIEALETRAETES